MSFALFSKCLVSQIVCTRRAAEKKAMMETLLRNILLYTEAFSAEAYTLILNRNLEILLPKK